jgi:hypothetical protein
MAESLNRRLRRRAKKHADRWSAIEAKDWITELRHVSDRRGWVFHFNTVTLQPALLASNTSHRPASMSSACIVQLKLDRETEVFRGTLNYSFHPFSHPKFHFPFAFTVVPRPWMWIEQSRCRS